MKALVSILSFIILVLSVVPCCAYHNESKHQVEKQCDDHSKKCDDCNGNCSPFYSCRNCVGFVSEFSTPLPILKIDISSITSIVPIIYNNPIQSTFFCKIWQPPKIV